MNINQAKLSTRITELCSAFLLGSITQGEFDELESWIAHSDENERLFHQMLLETEKSDDANEMQSIDVEAALLRARKNAGLETFPLAARRFSLLKYAASIAAVLVVVILGIYFLNQRLLVKGVEVTSGTSISPGKQGATLTLSNGKKIRLGDVGNGQLAQEAGVEITKTADGQVVYTIRHPEGGTTEGPVSGGGRSLPGVEMTKGVEMTGKGDFTKGDEMPGMNTIATAKGETYQLRLPDGTLVWLNAASKLTYTANLVRDGKRSVELSGEAYFEVTKDRSRPFIVASRGQKLEVLGTHFNVEAYGDENQIKTTLMEGSVKLNNATILKPDQQAWNVDGKIRVVGVDATAFVDWTRGEFYFDHEPLESVMRKISRWYNVEVIFEGKGSGTEVFSGTISRFDELSKVLVAINKSEGIRFKLEGKQLRVLR